MTTKMTARKLRELVTANKVSRRADGSFKLYRSFYYRHGQTELDFVERIIKQLTAAGLRREAFQVVESGEVDRPFRGGAPIERQSHWFVVLRFTEVAP